MMCLHFSLLPCFLPAKFICLYGTRIRVPPSKLYPDVFFFNTIFILVLSSLERISSGERRGFSSLFLIGYTYQKSLCHKICTYVSIEYHVYIHTICDGGGGNLKQILNKTVLYSILKKI